MFLPLAALFLIGPYETVVFVGQESQESEFQTLTYVIRPLSLLVNFFIFTCKIIFKQTHTHL